MALALAGFGATAEENAPEQPLTAQGPAPRPLLEISASEVPRFDDSSTRTSRTNVTLFPASQVLLGLSMGVTNASGPAVSPLAPYVPGGPMLDLGLHWRYEMDGNYRLDVTAWHRMGNVDTISLIQSRDPNYGVRAEMGLSSGQAHGFVADRGFVGLQLDSGARVTVRRSGGAPMLYYRNAF